MKGGVRRVISRERVGKKGRRDSRGIRSLTFLADQTVVETV
jgi:hypothetical protein